MNIKLTLGERLKDLRVERNLKLETLAEQTGLSKSALSKYESDDVTDLSIYAVTTLAEFYGVTTDYLLGVTENKKRPDAVLSDLHLSDGAVDVQRQGCGVSTDADPLAHGLGQRNDKRIPHGEIAQSFQHPDCPIIREAVEPFAFDGR